jgi:hypothetical protein
LYSTRFVVLLGAGPPFHEEQANQISLGLAAAASERVSEPPSWNADIITILRQSGSKCHLAPGAACLG